MKEVIRFHLQWSIAFGGGVDIVLIYFDAGQQTCFPRSSRTLQPTQLLLFSKEEAAGTHPPHSLPYAKRELGTIVQDFSGFSKIITKDLSSVVVIQNRSPAALHVLPPGFLKLRLNGETKNVADEYIHTGGWAVIHTYLSKNAAITQ